MNAYFCGFIVGFICLFAVKLTITYLRRKGSLDEKDFDERQLMARGNAYKTGFLVMIIAVAVDALCQIMGYSFYEAPLGQFAAICLAIAVFGVKAIRNDAFLGISQEDGNRRVLSLYIVVIGLQLFNTFGSLKEGEFIENGKLTMACISPICALTFMAIVIALIMEKRKYQREDED